MAPCTRLRILLKKVSQLNFLEKKTKTELIPFSIKFRLTSFADKSNQERASTLKFLEFLRTTDDSRNKEIACTRNWNTARFLLFLHARANFKRRPRQHFPEARLDSWRRHTAPSWSNDCFKGNMNAWPLRQHAEKNPLLMKEFRRNWPYLWIFSLSW